MSSTTAGTVVADKALLATLSISMMGNAKTDRKITKDTTNKYSAKEDAGRFTKVLIGSSYIQKIRDIVSEARDYHKSVTLPWYDRGGRLLPAKKHTDYAAKMRTFKANFETEVNNFIADYDQAILDAQVDLGQMYNADDYPAKSEVATKFSMRIDIDPVPHEDDFRTTLSHNEIETLKKELKAREQTRLEDAMGNVRERIINVLTPFVEKLADPKHQVYTTYFTNMQQLVEVLPALNIVGDPAIDAVCQEMKDKLCNITADDVRKDKETRKHAAKTGKDIMESYVGQE